MKRKQMTQPKTRNTVLTDRNQTLETADRLLQLMRCALRGQSCKPLTAWLPADWQRVFELSEMHKVLPMTFHTAWHSSLLRGLNPDFMGQWQQKAVAELSRQVVQQAEFLLLLGELRAEGLNPAVVKGMVCRNLYPQWMLRTSVDEDLLIESAEFMRCHESLLRHGLTADEGQADVGVSDERSYHRKGSPLYIELHRKPFPSQQEAYGHLNRYLSTALNHTVMIEVQGQQVRTLAPTDHLIFLILHAYKHFLHGGFGVRPLCDIGLFAEHYGRDIHWTAVQDVCREEHIDRFAAALFSLCAEQLGINLAAACLPSDWQLTSVDTRPLLDDILMAGVLGAADSNRMHSGNITLGAVGAERRRLPAASGLRQVLFPTTEYMRREYAYVDRLPLLLPAAWVHRIVSYLLKNCRGGSESAVQALKIGRERVSLLRKYGIIR